MKRDLSPMLLATLAIGGACLAASAYFVNFLNIPRFPADAVGFWAKMWADRLQFAVLLIAMAPGILVWWWAYRRFKRELRDGLWSEASLVRVRRLVTWQWWPVASFAVGVVCVILSGFRPESNIFTIFVLCLPTEAQMRLRQLVVPPPPPRPSGLAPLRDVQPLRSEHRGGPGA